MRPLDIVDDPQTLGEHLKKRRWEKRQYQREAAAEIGCNTWTYITWEKHGVRPQDRFEEAIAHYLS
ncbi:MAG: hypothetical protein ACRBBN_16955 [Methyloligellaceae bacterium]